MRRALLICLLVSTSAAVHAFEPKASAPFAKKRVAGQLSRSDIRLLEKGLTLMRTGQVSMARSLFIYCAMRGNPECATAAGDSYNPLILRVITRPDANEDETRAQWWYLFARNLENRSVRVAGDPAR
jgi:hypothetical protein